MVAVCSIRVTQSLEPYPEPEINLPLGGVTVSTRPPAGERPPRVLVVEPEGERREGLKALVASEGYDAIFLPDADEVLRLISEWEPDLIILADEWATGNGFETCGELRAAEGLHHTPIIMLSNSRDETAIAHGLLAGADDFIPDASRQIELSARIRVQLRHKRRYDALQRLRDERDNLRRDARIDPLTGVLNRRALESSVRDRISSEERFGVLFLDVDHFKSVNDKYGHYVGDQVLKAAAGALKKGIRPGDLLGRYGGEEFMILVAGAGPESARLVAKRLREAVFALEQIEGGPERVTISIGVAVFDPRQKQESYTELIKRADQALYAAKGAGRNCVVSQAIDGGMHVDAEDRAARSLLSAAAPGVAPCLR